MKKRLFAFALAVVIAFSGTGVFTASAVDTIDAAYEPDIPYIHINGLMTSDIYSDASNPDSPTVWPPQGGDIAKAVFKLLPAIAGLSITHNYDKFADRLIPALNGVLEPSFLDNSGDRTNKSGAFCEYPPKEEIKKDSMLWFDYDWRIDPFETAAELDKFINYVLECSGCDQVVLESHSYGGVVAYTYAAVYGTEKVRGFLFNASAALGETFTGELCKGELVLDAEALTEYLKGAFAHNDGEKFFNGLFRVLYKTGFTGWLCGKINKVVEKTHDRLFAETIYPMFGSWPSIWSMVTEEDFDSSVDYVFNEFYKNDGIDHSGMLEKVNKFDTEIRKNKTEIFNNINETSDLYIVARYGYCSMFCTPSWKIMNDMITDVSKASFGAATALYGETLGEDYLAGKDGKYISPEKNIDASTCMFPEQTWFIADYMHMRSKPDDMFETLLYHKGQATVDTFDKYPRFLKCSGSDWTIVPAVQ